MILPQVYREVMCKIVVFETLGLNDCLSFSHISLLKDYIQYTLLLEINTMTQDLSSKTIASGYH